MLGPFATASCHTPPVLHCHSPGVATVARRHCHTPPAHRCPQQHQRQHRQQRQRVTEGTAMAPWNGPNNIGKLPACLQHKLYALLPFSLFLIVFLESSDFRMYQTDPHKIFTVAMLSLTFVLQLLKGRCCCNKFGRELARIVLRHLYSLHWHSKMDWNIAVLM